VKEIEQTLLEVVSQPEWKEYFEDFRNNSFAFTSQDELVRLLLTSGLFKGDVQVVRLVTKQTKESFFHRIKR
jgi:DNA-binding transcriptional regulator/RsmH inhibitor MraZ